MSEDIGRHKGAIETLLHEKKELSRILQIVNAQLEKHLNELEEAGIDTDKFIDSLMDEEKSEGQQGRRKGRNDSRQSSNQDRSSSSRDQSRGNSSRGNGRDFSPSR